MSTNFAEWETLATGVATMHPGSFAQKYLTSRGVSHAVAYARGYGRADGDLPAEFSGSAAERHFNHDSVPGLVIPLFSSSSAKPLRHQIRFETPRVVEGKEVKFDGPAGQTRGETPGRTPVDFHPSTHAAAHDASVPLIITEGVVKADSILTAAETPVAVAALAGVWMGVYAATEDRPAYLVAGLSGLPLEGRDIFIAFDADVEGNLLGVAAPLLQLGVLLEEAGAKVRVVTVPPVAGDAHAGIDDAMAAGASLAGMLADAVPFEAWEADFAPRIAAEKPGGGVEKPHSVFSITSMLEADGTALEMAGTKIWRAGTTEPARSEAFIKSTPAGEVLVLTAPELIELNRGRKAVDPIGFLSLFYFAGDYRSAKAWASRFSDDLELCSELGEIGDHAPGVLARVSPAPLESFATSSVQEALDGGGGSFLITESTNSSGLPRRLVARVGTPEEFGLWRVDQQFLREPDGGQSPTPVEIWHKLTDYLLFQVATELVWTVEASGRMIASKADPATVTVRAVKADRTTRSVDGLSLADAASADRSSTILNFGLALPEAPMDRAAVSNMLRRLGYEHRVETRRFTQTGWLDGDNGPEFVLPAGSMTAAGPVGTYRVWGVVGSDPTPDAISP